MVSLLKRFLIGHRMPALAKRFLLAYWALYGVVVKALPYWTSNAVLGKALPSCLLDIVWLPWQSASFLPIGHRMVSLLKRFLLAYWTSYGVLVKALPYWTSNAGLGKALPSCLLGIVWCRC